ncbi:MAG: hypothetical protein KGZ65_04100 [Sphingomonadales bacterium]|nr:hypothetical protein [Sphingomonadaceae bacterium]MBS3930395.1 hypothetical protein [Sphingomonadales bacterium]
MTYVEKRMYGRPGPCEYPRGVKVVRWAPTPMTTKVIKGLCAAHKKVLDAGRRIKLVDGTIL